MHYLIDAIVLLAAAVITVPVFQALRLGAIPGFLLAGVALGPSGIGYFSNFNDIQHLAELGIVFLLFVIGIEIRPTHFWQMRRHVFGLGICQLALTALVITYLVYELLNVRLGIALLIGAALALSSTAFVLQLLTEHRALNTQHGRPAVAVLLLQDIAVVPLLAYIAILNRGEYSIAVDVILAFVESVAIILLVVLLARYVLNPLLRLLARFASNDIFTVFALLLVLGFAGLFENAGFSMAMGAFVAGLLIADSSFRHQIIAEVEPFRMLLLGLFFITMGMSLNIEMLFLYPGELAASLLCLITVKFFVLLPLARAFKVPSQAAIALSLQLAQSGEFALVLFGTAYAVGILETTLFQPLLILVLLSMLITPALDACARHIIARTKTPKTEPLTTPQNASPGILIAGYGRMGHRIGELLERLNVPYIAIDNNVSIVEQATAQGKPVYFGEAQKPEVLKAAGASKAPLAIVAIDNLEGAERVVASLRVAFPKLPIFARGHNRSRCKELRSQGANITVSETFEASAEIAHEALLSIGVNKDRIERTMVQFKKDYYAEIGQTR